MPVVLRHGGLRYLFLSKAPREPPHVHVKGGGRGAKIWLKPEIAITESFGFNSRELATIRELSLKIERRS